LEIQTYKHLTSHTFIPAKAGISWGLGKILLGFLHSQEWRTGQHRKVNC